MPNFIDYDDDGLHIVVPDDLKAKRMNGWLFMRPKRKWNKPGLLSIVVEVLVNDYQLDASRRLYFTPTPGVKEAVFEWMGQKVTKTVGRIVDRPRGARERLESLVTESRIDPVTNAVDVLHFYNTLFVDNKRYVWVQFGGRGPIEEFDQACNTVVESIKLKK